MKIADSIPRLLVLIGQHNCVDVLAILGEFARTFLGFNFSFSKLE